MLILAHRGKRDLGLAEGHFAMGKSILTIPTHARPKKRDAQTVNI